MARNPRPSAPWVRVGSEIRHNTSAAAETEWRFIECGLRADAHIQFLNEHQISASCEWRMNQFRTPTPPGDEHSRASAHKYLWRVACKLFTYHVLPLAAHNTGIPFTCVWWLLNRTRSVHCSQSRSLSSDRLSRRTIFSVSSFLECIIRSSKLQQLETFGLWNLYAFTAVIRTS